jgi:hypothetical protein
MERIVYRKTLDVHKNGIQFTLQGFETADNMSRKIEISLMASGDTIDFPCEIEALMYVTTPSAKKPSINGCTIKDNKIIYDVLPIAEEGITEMQLKIIHTSVNGAKGVLGTPRFAVEVSKSNLDDGEAEQTSTYTALENAIAKAKGVYDSRLIGIELDEDCVFRAKYADGTTYESDVLKELFLKGDVLLSQSYAKGGSGVRAGEDTDNSMYYSLVSKNASTEAGQIRDDAQGILVEVQKHGVYTAFFMDFDKGELMYKSPKYTFSVNEESGELEAQGRVYDAFPIESEEHPGCYYRIVDGEVEWINPPKVGGALYKTTERYHGKAVYVFTTELYEFLSGQDECYPNFLKHGMRVLSVSGVKYGSIETYSPATPITSELSVQILEMEEGSDLLILNDSSSAFDGIVEIKFYNFYG